MDVLFFVFRFHGSFGGCRPVRVCRRENNLVQFARFGSVYLPHRRPQHQQYCGRNSSHGQLHPLEYDILEVKCHWVSQSTCGFGFRHRLGRDWVRHHRHDQRSNSIRFAECPILQSDCGDRTRIIPVYGRALGARTFVRGDDLGRMDIYRSNRIGADECDCGKRCH